MTNPRVHGVRLKQRGLKCGPASVSNRVTYFDTAAQGWVASLAPRRMRARISPFSGMRTAKHCSFRSTKPMSLRKSATRRHWTSCPKRAHSLMNRIAVDPVTKDVMAWAGVASLGGLQTVAHNAHDKVGPFIAASYVYPVSLVGRSGERVTPMVVSHLTPRERDGRMASLD